MATRMPAIQESHLVTKGFYFVCRSAAIRNMFRMLCQCLESARCNTYAQSKALTSFSKLSSACFGSESLRNVLASPLVVPLQRAELWCVTGLHVRNNMQLGKRRVGAQENLPSYRRLCEGLPQTLQTLPVKPDHPLDAASVGPICQMFSPST